MPMTIPEKIETVLLGAFHSPRVMAGTCGAVEDMGLGRFSVTVEGVRYTVRRDGVGWTVGRPGGAYEATDTHIGEAAAMLLEAEGGK